MTQINVNQPSLHAKVTVVSEDYGTIHSGGKPLQVRLIRADFGQGRTIDFWAYGDMSRVLEAVNALGSHLNRQGADFAEDRSRLEGKQFFLSREARNDGSIKTRLFIMNGEDPVNHLGLKILEIVSKKDAEALDLMVRGLTRQDQCGPAEGGPRPFEEALEFMPIS